MIGPSAKDYLNGVSVAGRQWPNIECWLGSLAIFHGGGGVQNSIPKEAYKFVIF